jgi:hypothetical protein
MRNLARPLQIFLWSYVFIYAVFSSLSITQVDLWWQLSEGAHILRTWSLPTQPAVAFGLPATPYFDEYAGYEVVLAVLYHLTGFVGLWMVFATIYLAILFLPGATTAQKYPAFDLPSTMALLVAVLLIRARLEQRPELVGGLLQVLLMVLLRATSLEKITPRTLLWLFLLFLVWTNIHSTFIFGFFTLGLWMVSELWTRSKSAPFAVLLRHAVLPAAVAIFASILHPYGPRRLLFPFLQASDPGSTALSPEMWPITDFSTPVGFFLLVSFVLLAWGIVTTRGLPPWLILFSIFSVMISLKSFRFIDFTAISLLFVYAARHEQAAVKTWSLPWFLALPRDLVLCLLCLFFLLLDVFNLLSSYAELRSERRLATHGLRYASDIAEYPVDATGPRIPVLCGHGMGSYLSFKGNGHFRPLLDSGLSHFSDDTKRYFFFVLLEPAALHAALDQLNVDYVMLDWDTFPWIPTLHRFEDWQFVACTPNGMIWKRSPGGPHPLTAAERAQVSDAVAAQLKNGDMLGAFTYSTLLDRPADSLTLLKGYRTPPWHESFFNSLCAWVDSLPLADVQAFLAKNSCGECPMVGAILSARVGPEVFDRFMAGHPQGSALWFWKGVQVEVLIQKGDVDRARAVFDSISPVPASSTTYYRLWHQVHDGDAAGPHLGAYGQWQTWDESGATFIKEMSARLNERIAALNQSFPQ